MPSNSLGFSIDERVLAVGLVSRRAGLVVLELPSCEKVVEIQVNDPKSLVPKHLVDNVLSNNNASDVKIPDNLYEVNFSPDGLMLAAAGDDGLIRLYKTEDWKLIRNVGIEGKRCRTVSFSSNSGLFATGHSNGVCSIWHSNSGKLQQAIEAHRRHCSLVRLSIDGQSVLTASTDGSARIWDLETAKHIASFGPYRRGRAFRDAIFSSDGKSVTLAGSDKIVRKISIADQELQREVNIAHNVEAIAYSPNESLLAVASGDGTLALHDGRSFERLRELRGHEKSIGDVVFSPSGKTLVSGCINGSIRLWNVEPKHTCAIAITHAAPALIFAEPPQESPETDPAREPTAPTDEKIQQWIK